MSARAGAALFGLGVGGEEAVRGGAAVAARGAATPSAFGGEIALLTVPAAVLMWRRRAEDRGAAEPVRRSDRGR